MQASSRELSTDIQIALPLTGLRGEGVRAYPRTMVVSAACQDAVAEFLLSCGSQEPPLALFTQSQGTPGLAPLLATDGPASYFHDSWYEAPCLASPANLHILERAGASKDVPPEEDESWLADYHGLTPEAKAAVAGRLEAAHKQLNAALVLHFKDLLQPALMDVAAEDEVRGTCLLTSVAKVSAQQVD